MSELPAAVSLENCSGKETAFAVPIGIPRAYAFPMTIIGSRLLRSPLTWLVCAVTALVAGSAQSTEQFPAMARSPARSGMGAARVTREVRHELVMLPYYGVFDNLAYRVEGETVTLLGQVTRPTLKSDAERAVKRIEGVGRVDNQIEVLPLSPNDDGIRLATYRAIFSRDGLDRYALLAVPSIHIVVANGNVKLEGIVATESDKNLAGITANGVSGVFSVVNNLAIEGK